MTDVLCFPLRQHPNAVESTAASLEKLLIEFFSEVDKRKVRMADVYGRRYVGHEDRLFVELARRYGKDRVTVLQTRYEASLATPAVTAQESAPHGNGAPATRHNDPLLVGRPHDGFLIGTVRDPVMLAKYHQIVGTASLDQPLRRRSEQAPPKSPQRVSPQPRKSARFPKSDTVHLGTDAPPLPIDNVAGSGTKASPIMWQSEPSTDHLTAVTDVCDAMSRTTVAAAVPSTLAPPPTADKTSAAVVAKLPVAEPVTLESLLKDMYKKHQPDKLQNASQVARQFAGRERELVGLLRAKYGALSVKRLEENLPLLEATAAKARAEAAKAKKTRGWCSTLLVRSAVAAAAGLTFGSLGLALLNSHVCSRSDFPSPPDAATCAPFASDLDAFGTRRQTQSMPLDCFCFEWEEREAALWASASVVDGARLAAMLPFSHATVDAFVSDVQAHDAYVQYAAPVIEMSKEYAPAVQSALSDASVAIAKRVSELQQTLFHSDASAKSAVASNGINKLSDADSRTPHGDTTTSEKPVESTLTKVAQASKALVETMREDLKATEDAHDGSDRFGSVSHDTVAITTTTTDEVTRNDDSAAAPDAIAASVAVVEIAVTQEGSDVVYSHDASGVAGDALSPIAAEQLEQLNALGDNAVSRIETFESLMAGASPASSAEIEASSSVEDVNAQSSRTEDSEDVAAVDTSTADTTEETVDAATPNSARAEASGDEDVQPTDASDALATTISVADLMAELTEDAQATEQAQTLAANDHQANEAIDVVAVLSEVEAPSLERSADDVTLDLAPAPTSDSIIVEAPAAATAAVDTTPAVTDEATHVDDDEDDDDDFAFDTVDAWELLALANEQAAAAATQ